MMKIKDKVYLLVRDLIDTGEWHTGEVFNFGNLSGYARIFECSPDAIHGILSNTKKYSVLADNGIELEIVSNQAKNYRARLVRVPPSIDEVEAAEIEAEIENNNKKNRDLQERLAALYVRQGARK